MKTVPFVTGFAFAASAALISMPVCAQDGVNTYGEIRLTTNQIKSAAGTTQNELRDNASRLGFRGTEDVGHGLQALYGLELGYAANTGALGDPAFRTSYVGLRGGWGTLALGRLDSANPTGSPFYSQIIKLTSFAPNDAGATATSTVMFNSRNRTSSSIGYASPKWGGASMKARFYHRGAGTVAEPEDSARSVDLGLDYEVGSLSVGLGWGGDARRGGLKANEFQDKWQIGVNYNFKPVDVYVVTGVDRYLNTVTTRHDVKYHLLGAAYRDGPHKVVLNLMRRDVQTSLGAVRNRQQLSYQHALSMRTELQFFYDNDGVDSSKNNVRIQALGMGVKHRF